MIDPIKRKQLIADMENNQELKSSINNLSKSLKPFEDLVENAKSLAESNIVVPYPYEKELNMHIGITNDYFTYDAIEEFIDTNFNSLSKELILNIFLITNHLGDNLQFALSNLEKGNYTSSLLLLFSILDGVVYSLYNDAHKSSVKNISSNLIDESTYNPRAIRSVLTTSEMISKLYLYGISKDIEESDEFPMRNKFMHGMNLRSATKRDCYIVFSAILNITTIHLIEEYLSEQEESVIEII